MMQKEDKNSKEYFKGSIIVFDTKDIISEKEMEKKVVDSEEVEK